MITTKAQRFEILRRDGFRCRYCARGRNDLPVGVTLQVDHVVPQAKGGTNDPENLVAACSECNVGKGAKLLTAEPTPSKRTLTGAPLAMDSQAACAAVGVGHRTLLKIIKRGDIRAKTVGSKVLVETDSLLAWFASLRSAA